MNRKKSIVVLIFIICMALLGNVYASTSEINEFEEKTGLTVEKIADDSRTLVPLRAISEAFGCKVLWSGYLNRVDIVGVID